MNSRYNLRDMTNYLIITKWFWSACASMQKTHFSQAFIIHMEKISPIYKYSVLVFCYEMLVYVNIMFCDGIYRDYFQRRDSC